jgi:Glyoxalase-like domain
MCRVTSRRTTGSCCANPSGSNVNVSLQVVPEPRVGKNRLHLDLYAEDRDAEIERIVGLGATIRPRTPEPEEDFVVLADPEGNLFCVIQKDGLGSVRELTPRAGWASARGRYRFRYRTVGGGPLGLAELEHNPRNNRMRAR